jgi:AcrR family transcriptional regulator
MPKQVDAAALKREIRSAARQVFARRGVRGTGLTHVAEEVGMGRSSLYHYYPDKDALLSDLVIEMLRQERALFRTCLRGPGSVLARVRHLLDTNVALFDDWAAVGRVMVELRLNDARRFRRFFRGFRAELAAALVEGQASGEIDSGLDTEMSAATLIGAIDGLLFQYFLDPRALPKERVRKALHSIVSRSLRA